MATKAEHEHDQRTAEIAAGLGMEGSLRLLMEAAFAGLSQSLGLALRTQETGIKGDGNVFGHDATIFVGGHVKRTTDLPKVTKPTSPTRPSAARWSAAGCRASARSSSPTTPSRTRQIGSGAAGSSSSQLPRRLPRPGPPDSDDRLGAHALASYNGGASNPNFDYAASVLKHKAFWHKMWLAISHKTGLISVMVAQKTGSGASVASRSLKI
jgi:hypothetical protein